MDSLEELRKEIDNIDDELVRLFEKRMDAAIKIGRYKKEKGLPIFNEEREKEVLNKNINKLMKKEYEEELKEFFQSLMDISKEFQKKL